MLIDKTGLNNTPRLKDFLLHRPVLFDHKYLYSEMHNNWTRLVNVDPNLDLKF
jgi:hypothetical protein